MTRESLPVYALTEKEIRALEPKKLTQLIEDSFSLIFYPDRGHNKFTPDQLKQIPQRAFTNLLDAQ